MATPPPRLLEKDALHAVESALGKMKGVVTTFEHSYGAVDHKLSCDAMVFSSDYPNYAEDVHRNECIRRGAAHREAVELCFAVSCCAGFGFHENPEFWCKVLPLDGDSTAILAIGDIEYAFPRILFQWSRNRDQFAILEHRLRGFFGFSTKLTTTRSEEFRAIMDMLAAYMLPERQANTIEISLDLAYVIHHDVELPHVSALVNRVYASLKAASNARFKLHSVTRFRVKCNQYGASYARLQDQMRRLPVGIVVQLEWDNFTGAPITPEERDLAFQVMVGVRGSEWSGRLRELKVDHGRDDYISSLCTRLPSSQSLETISVRTIKLTDLLWLGYAMFHPRSHQTRWRTLKMDAYNVTATEFALMDLCAKTGGWVFALLAAMTSSSTTPAAIYARMEETIAQGKNLSAKPATIRTPTGIFLLPSYDQSLKLPQGHSLEVCDTRWTTADEPSASDVVEVVVAGFGVGLIQASCLEMQISSPATSTDAISSCISTLNVTTRSRESANRLALLFTREHLSIELMYSDHHWRMSDVASLLPTVRSIKGCWFTSDCVGMDFSLPVWRHVRSMEISCESYHLVVQLVDVLVEAKFTLEHLLLRFYFKSSAPYQEWTTMYLSLHGQLSKLMNKSPRLQSLSVDVRAAYVKPYASVCDYPMNQHTRNANARDAKLAFLSSVEQSHSTGTSSALGSLGVDVLHLVFTYVGNWPGYYLVHDVDAHRFVFASRLYRTDSQLARR